MGRHGDLDNQDTEAAQASQANTSSIPTENVVIIACGSTTFHINLTSTKEQTDVFEIRPGIACKYLFSSEKLVLETVCANEIKITGKASALRYIYVRTKGKLVFGLDVLNEHLHFRFDAGGVCVDTKLSTQAAGGILVHGKNGNIVFNQDCAANILVLSSAEMQLNNARLDVAKTYIAAGKLISSGKSAIYIRHKKASDLLDTADIVPPSIAQVIKSQSHIDIGNSDGNCNFDISEAACWFDSLESGGDVHFYRSVINYAKVLTRAAKSKFTLHDSTLHTKGLNVKGSLDEETLDEETLDEETLDEETLDNSTLDVLESDIYVDGKICFDKASHVRLYGAQICGDLVQIKGTVQYLDNNPRNLVNKTKPESRIVSSAELSKDIHNFIATLADIIAADKINTLTDDTFKQLTESLYKLKNGERYKAIPEKVIRTTAEKVIAEDYKNIKPSTLERIGQELNHEMSTWVVSERFNFSETKHLTTKHTSLKQLRDFVEGKTLPANERHLRVLSVPGDGDCVLYSLVINLLYIGMVHDERAKVATVLSAMYSKHKIAVLQSKAYAEVQDGQFNDFLAAYQQATYYGQYSGFISAYFDSNSEDFVVTSFIAACARLAVRTHSIPQINKIYNPKNAANRFAAAEKKLKHYPELLAGAKLELEQSLAAAMSEFNPHQFINIEYVQSYLDSIGINSVVKYKSDIAPLTFSNDKSKLSVTFWVSGNNDLNRHYEPELDLHLLSCIKFGASITRNTDENADVLLDMMTIMCYYMPRAVNAFGAEYKAKIEAKTREIFETAQNVENDCSMVVFDTANVSGVNGHLYSTGALLVQGKVVVDNCVVTSNSIKVTSTGGIDGGKNLSLQSYSMLRNNGKIMSDATQIISDYLISTNAAYIAGKYRLDIQTLVHVLNLSYLYTTSGNINTVANINTGITHVWNLQVDTLINLDGVTIPCLPRRTSDLCDRGKLFTFLKMGVGVFSADVALAVQAATRTYAIAQTTKQMYALYGQLKRKNWREYSMHDTAALLMQIKRAANEAYGAYRIAPSAVRLSQAGSTAASTLQSSNTFQNTSSFISDFKQNGLKSAKDLKSNNTLSKFATGVKDDLSASAAASKTKFGEFCKQRIVNAGADIESSKNTIKQAWQDTKDLRSKVVERGGWLPSPTDIPADSALKDIIGATKDVAALALPYKHVDSALDVRYGVQAAFSNTSQSFWGFEGPLLAINGNEYNQNLFTQYNCRYSMHMSYDYNTVCRLNYVNYGAVYAVNWHLSARDYIERGTTYAPCKIFDIRGNVFVASGGRMSGMSDISGTIGGDLIIDGVAQIGGGALRVGGRIKFSATSDIATNDAVLLAQGLSHLGHWNYSGNLYAELEQEVESAPDSMMRGETESVATIKAKTESLQGKGEHYQIFYDIEQMDAIRARNLAYQQDTFANVTAAKSIKVTTQSKDNVMYSGLRKDGAVAELVTGGGVILDPVTYTRARGDVFANYNEAASVAANYASYKIPPPPPPSKRKRFWRKVFKEVVKVFEGIGAVVSAASTPEALAIGSAIAGAAAGVDQLVKHGERKDNKRIEEGNRRVLEGNQVVNRAILAANQQSANLGLLEAHARQNAQVLASGGRINNAYRQQSQQQFAQQQQQLNHDFVVFANDMEQAHNQDLYDLRVQNDAARKRISHTGGPKVGFGGAVNTGSTGTSFSITTTIGSQNPVHSKVELYSMDSSRLRNPPPSNEQTRAPKAPLPPIEHTAQNETIEPPRSNTQVFVLDELGGELKLEPMEDSAQTKFTRRRFASSAQQQSVLDDDSYLTAHAFRTGRPVIADVDDNRSFNQQSVQQNEQRQEHHNASARALNRPVTQTYDNDYKHAIQWLKMAWKAANGDNSLEVREWQQINRGNHPNMAAFSDGLQNSKERQVFDSFAGGFSDAIKSPVQFLAEEAARLNLQQRTKTMQLADIIGTFIGYEAARLTLNEQTRTWQFVNHVASFIQDDLNRLRTDQPTVMGSRLLNEFRSLANMSAPELAGHLGADLGNALVLYGIGNGFRAANQSANSFTMAHEFRSPITFRFEAGRLNGGLPFDQVGVRNPFVKKTIKGRIKDAQLPIEGKIRFVPPDDYVPSIPLQRGPQKGFLDRFDNEWTKGPSRTLGESFEWDVILSDLGKKQLGWASRDGKHLNVSLKGKLTH